MALFWLWRFLAMAVASLLRPLYSPLPRTAALGASSLVATSSASREASPNSFWWGIEVFGRLHGHFFASKATSGPGAKGKEELSRPPIAVAIAKSLAHFQWLMAEAKAKKGGLAVVFFTSRSSDSCRLISRAFNYLSTQHHDITFLRIDFAKPELQPAVKAAGVTEIPTFQLYKKGKVIAQMTGDAPDKLKEMVAGSQFYAKYRKK